MSQAKDALESILADGLIGEGKLIEFMEEAGGIALLDAPLLPIDMLGVERADVEAKTGILFADDVSDLFVRVVLPAGWRKAATKDPRSLYLVDKRCRKRGVIFYKASFSDRSADLSWSPFYQSRQDHDVKNDCVWTTIGNANGVEIYRHRLDPPCGGKETIAEHVRAHIWLDSEYPEWQDPLAYWD